MTIKHYGFAKWNQESYDESETGGEVLMHISPYRPALDSEVETKAKADRERMEEESLRTGHIREDGTIKWEEGD